MNHKDLRVEIEQYIRHSGVGNETFQEIHSKYDNDFFRIFEDIHIAYNQEKNLHKNFKNYKFYRKKRALKRLYRNYKR
jgi:hypothetical protein